MANRDLQKLTATLIRLITGDELVDTKARLASELVQEIYELGQANGAARAAIWKGLERELSKVAQLSGGDWRDLATVFDAGARALGGFPLPNSGAYQGGVAVRAMRNRCTEIADERDEAWAHAREEVSDDSA